MYSKYARSHSHDDDVIGHVTGSDDRVTGSKSMKSRSMRSKVKVNEVKVTWPEVTSFRANSYRVTYHVMSRLTRWRCRSPWRACR